MLPATVAIFEKLSEEIDVQNFQAKEALEQLFKQEIQQARNQETSAEMLSTFAENRYAIVREAIATNLKTPVSSLEKLANDPVWFVCKAVATNPNLSRLGLKLLAAHPLKPIRLAIAENSNTSIETLEILAGDKELDVVCAVAMNTSTSAEILTVLADRNDRVIDSVAGNPNTPVEVLEFLLREQHYDPISPPHTLSLRGLIRLAENPNASIQILTLLTEKVMSMLVESVMPGSFYLKEFGLALAKAIVENPRTLEPIRRKLSQHTLEAFHTKVTQLLNECIDGNFTLESFHMKVRSLIV